jgi:AraC-like DNA-binding protein
MTWKIIRPSRMPLRATVLSVRESLRTSMPAIGCLDYNAGRGVQHIHLPSDLYTISLRCEDEWLSTSSTSGGLTLVVYSIRTQARPFMVSDRRQSAVASLTPLGMLNAFGSTLDGLMDRPIPVEALCGGAAARQLALAMKAAGSLEGRVHAFAKWLEERIVNARVRAQGALRASCAAVDWSVSKESIERSISDLASTQGVTRRQLERDFHQYIGVSPATYRRLVKFQRAASSVAQGKRLLDTAAEHGFADQSHMNRVFRDLGDITPGDLARDGIRPGRDVFRAGLAGRVFLLDIDPSDIHARSSSARSSPLMRESIVAAPDRPKTAT